MLNLFALSIHYGYAGRWIFQKIIILFKELDGKKPPVEINDMLKLSELNNRMPDRFNKLKIPRLSKE